MGITSKAAEKKVIIELTELLKKNSEKVLSGEINLCLTTNSLNILATNFRRFSENAAEEESSRGQGSKGKEEIDVKTWRENIRTLFDFVMKVKALKVILGSYTMHAPIQISRFRSLQVLEVKKVPIHMVEGLSKLRGQLREISVSKSLQNVKDLLEICGGDRTPGLMWSHLKIAHLSFNTVQELDQSLKYIPFVEVLDLSHNSITKTGYFLQNLLGLVRINLGYNMLKSVPQFSSENRFKVKTLVLRNNNLEDLEGLEQLCALEELDVAENFLLDHRVLQELLALKRLQVLCLLGNPLCYKTNHRQLSVQYICPQADLAVFLLDGRRLTHDEITVLQDNKYRNIYNQDPENDAEEVGSLDNDEQGSNIAVLQLSPHAAKKKRGHRRTQSRERIPRIANIEDSLTDENRPRSIGTSASTSYVEDSELCSQRQEDERYYETLREHYKDDWLKALSVNQKHSQASPAAQDCTSADVEEKDTTRLESVKTDNVEEQQQPEVHAEIHAQSYTPVTSSNSLDAECQQNDYTPVTSPASPEGVKIGECTDIYDLSQTTADRKCRENVNIYSQSSVDSPSSPGEENTEQYGAESEPFIMMLPTDDMKQLFVTVNERFIFEKDLNGRRVGALDLKCLQKFKKSEEKCYGGDVDGGCVFTVWTMQFDYVRKDMRRRQYAMESLEEAMRFESLISNYIKTNQEDADIMQCLKCHHEFIVDAGEQSTSISKCPKCKSKMVIKSDKTIISGMFSDTENTEKSKKKPEAPADENMMENKTRRSEKRPGLLSEVADAQYSHRESIDVPSRSSIADRYSLGNSLKEYVDELIPILLLETSKGDNSQDSPKKKEIPFSTKVNASSSQSETQISELKNNLPASDVWKTGQKSAARDSLSSVESDITVLAANSSRASVAAMSQSSRESFATPTTSIGQYASSTAETNGNTGHVSTAMGKMIDNGEVNWTKDKQEQKTQCGSPLSNTVCSSMVSSVYENTLTGSGEDAASKENNANSSHERPNQDDLIAESVPLRRSKIGKPKSRQSNNRNFIVYDSDFESSQQDSNVIVVVEDAEIKIRNRDTSIYDISESSQKVGQSFSDSNFGDARESNSINDSAISDDSLDTSYNDSPDLLSHYSRWSHDQSLTSESASEHSSPLRRAKANSSFRSESGNRSAIYLHDSDHESEVRNNSVYISEFNSELSPIKRTGSSRTMMRKHAAEVSSISDENSENPDETSEVRDCSQEETVCVQLPWEQDGNQSKEASKRDESLNHDEFVNIDHNIKLHLELKVFTADETAQCAIKCNIVQYMHVEEVRSLLVISTHRITIFRIVGDGNVSPDWLKLYEAQPITELRYIDIGLGYQTLRLEFETECSSYTLLIADEGRCKKFLTLISDLVSLSDHSNLEGIVKCNLSTLQNLDLQVLTPDEDTELQQLVRFLMVKYADTETDSDKTHSLVITQTDLILVDENHQWPLPRLQAPLSPDIKGIQFTVVQREKINNIETLSYNEHRHTELRLTFFETSHADNAKLTWMISFGTVRGVKVFVDAIRGPWENEFGVSLDITPMTFTDEESSSLVQ